MWILKQGHLLSVAKNAAYCFFLVSELLFKQVVTKLLIFWKLRHSDSTKTYCAILKNAEFDKFTCPDEHKHAVWCIVIFFFSGQICCGNPQIETLFQIQRPQLYFVKNASIFNSLILDKFQIFFFLQKVFLKTIVFKTKFVPKTLLFKAMAAHT